MIEYLGGVWKIILSFIVFSLLYYVFLQGAAQSGCSCQSVSDLETEQTKNKRNLTKNKVSRLLFYSNFIVQFCSFLSINFIFFKD